MFTPLMERLGPYGLTKTECMSIVNLCPGDIVALDTIVEECDMRFTAEQQEEMVAVIAEVLAYYLDVAKGDPRALNPGVCKHLMDNGLLGIISSNVLPKIFSACYIKRNSASTIKRAEEYSGDYIIGADIPPYLIFTIDHSLPVLEANEHNRMNINAVVLRRLIAIAFMPALEIISECLPEFEDTIGALRQVTESSDKGLALSLKKRPVRAKMGRGRLGWLSSSVADDIFFSSDELELLELVDAL
ncbi:hypothetical protein B0A49_01752 [Cryomyces minteri]|uniref:DNA-directed RNA polymerase III subunit RPC9 n=1 Tax=Cryomyces minteri TaxID=331657 RepID=A0A4U0XYS7_9PEZI|nr:hypothetical protein B0A49_01752 [Cryomyces minteri]